MTYFYSRWPVPTDWVHADDADELFYNHGSKLPPELTPIPPSLDLPVTVTDMERESMFGPSGIVSVLLTAGTTGPEDGDYIAQMRWPDHITAYEMRAGSGPAWFVDGLEVGKTYWFSTQAMHSVTNPGGLPVPRVRVEVLGTAQASEYEDLPELVFGDEYVEFGLLFTAEATSHYLALTTETAWETRGQGTGSTFQFVLLAPYMEQVAPPLTVGFTLPVPQMVAELTDDELWDEPEPEDPEEGGDEDPPDPPDPRDLPSSIPDETYIALLDENGDEITGDGYARVPAPEWGYDDDTETITNLQDIVTSTPTGQWPPINLVAIVTSTGETRARAPLASPVTPTPGVPVTIPANTVVAPVDPDPRLRRVSEVMPTPTLNADGFPVGWEPTSVVDEVYGRVQVVVEGTDISQLLGKPLPVPRWTRAEPFGSVSATITVPQITAFHNLGSFGWCKKGANVIIRLIRKGQTNVRRFDGFISTFGHSEDTGQFTIECIGILYQADQQLRLPATDTRPRDVGTVIRSTLNTVVGRRYHKVPKRNTGCKTGVLGAWEPRVTGYIQQLLATAVDNKGRQWTVKCESRSPVIARKDTTTVSWTVHNGQRGVRVELQSDDMPNVLYGEGVREDGGRWRNMKYPNWRPDDTPPFPNWNPIRPINLGTTDAQTDSGDGVSVWQEKVGQKVTGRFSQDDRQVLRDRQKAAGITVDGSLGPQSWAAEFATGSNTGSLDGAFPMPLAYSKRVMPRVHGGDGEDLGANPDYRPNVIRVEDKIDFGQGVTLKEGRRAAKAQLKRDSGRGWSGTVAFQLDPQECSRFDVVEGSNGVIRGFRGQDLQVHVARVDYGPDEVVAYVDTRARDYPTLAAIMERERNATDPAKAFVKRSTASKLGSDRAEWDAEAPGGRVPKHAVFAGLWTVLRIPVASYGTIVRTRYTSTGPAAKFAVGVFDRPITAARLNSLLGNPLSGEANPWQDHADELEDLGLLMAWGWAKQPCGYYPGSYSTPDGEDQSPLTGRMVDDASWEFASTRPPWLWVAEIADRHTQLSGRFYPGVV